MPYRTVVLDNGGSHIKAGFAGEPDPRIIVPNTAARIRRQLRLLVSDETEAKIKDFSLLQYIRPTDRGYVHDAFIESIIWERLFSPKQLDVDTSDSNLLLTTPPFTPETLEDRIDELAFETFNFRSLHRTLPQQLSAYCLQDKPSSSIRVVSGGKAHYLPAPGLQVPGLPMAHSGHGIIVDSGFSFTHVVPFQRFVPVSKGIRRIDVGGKLMTNYLKELISYRQWNMMEDTWIVNRIKERLCYLAYDYPVEMRIAQRLESYAPHEIRNPRLTSFGRARPVNDGVGPGMRREYVLPDFVKILSGYVRGSDEDPLKDAAPATLQREEITTLPQPPAMQQTESVSEPDEAPETGARSDVESGTSMSETSPSEDEEAEVLRSATRKRDGDYGGGKRARTGSSSVAAQPARKRAARAASSGVAALTSVMRQGGVVGVGDEDEDEEESTKANAVPALKQQANSELQVLVMNNERISVPEVLFHPCDVGLQQGGLAEAIVAAVQACPPELGPALWSSIVLTGGSALLPGLEQRLYRELTALAPAGYDINLYTPENPIVTAWRGGAWFASLPDFADKCVTKAQYHEEGPRVCRRMFRLPVDEDAPDDSSADSPSTPEQPNEI